jgi:hypothetical protein
MAALVVTPGTATQAVNKAAVSAASPSTQVVQFSASVQRVSFQLISANNSFTSSMYIATSLDGVNFVDGTFIYGPGQAVLAAPGVFYQITSQISQGDLPDQISVWVLGI